MEITLAHGSGGAATGELIRTVFAKAFDNPILRQMDDSAVVPGSRQLAVTTDSFVVQPLFFPGGDIGRLAVCGTVNDLLMRGATPKYLTAGFILETGCTTQDLSRIARSMAATADEAGVTIVAGDTKVVEGSGNIYINTAGVGFLPTDTHNRETLCWSAAPWATTTQPFSLPAWAWTIPFNPTAPPWAIWLPPCCKGALKCTPCGTLPGAAWALYCASWQRRQTAA